MHEHLYYIDFGAQAAAYVDTFMAAINWPNAARNFAEIGC
jgi:superoxide dismutase, Fe-Mn family